MIRHPEADADFIGDGVVHGYAKRGARERRQAHLPRWVNLPKVAAVAGCAKGERHRPNRSWASPPLDARKAPPPRAAQLAQRITNITYARCGLLLLVKSRERFGDFVRDHPGVSQAGRSLAVRGTA